MDTTFYLQQFKSAANKIDKALLEKKSMDVETGEWLESIVLRLQKKHWGNPLFTKPQTDSSIFFSIWISNKFLVNSKIFYNIHALKLRQFKGYTITSRMFATAFREKFRLVAHHWPNVNTDYGPQTLMEGWKQLDITNLEKDILELANQFLTIDYLIDDLLLNFKIKNKN